MPPKKKVKLEPDDKEPKSSRKVATKSSSSKAVAMETNVDDDMAQESKPGILMAWKLVDMVADLMVEDERWAVANTVRLLHHEGCSIPFVTRYRKEQTNGMEADKVREVAATIEKLKSIHTKASVVVKQVTKSGKMTDNLMDALRNAKTMEELDHLYAPYKTGSKSTLAERARKLGLEPAAKSALYDPFNFNPNKYVNPKVKGLTILPDVDTGIHNIIADMISKDKNTLNKLRQNVKDYGVYITSTKIKTRKNAEEPQDAHKFKLYFDFKFFVKCIKSHQVLALNRGEHLKILNIKVILQDFSINKFKSWCERKWIKGNNNCPEAVQTLIRSSIDDACTRLMFPLISRETRSELTRKADCAAIDVFGQNLKRLLLTPPVKGKTVMGVDPGFKHGCKIAVTSTIGTILYTGIISLFGNKAHSADLIGRVLQQHRCETIALGNGTACRETEMFLAKLIKDGAFAPLDVMYCIVDESGASIYSVSPDAQKEMPDLDPNLRSAVSIARRLQDPLAELVKVEPKHLGVGMYQHDVSEKCLKDALDGVIEDCVSFVGVDLNVCSASMLRRISGLDVKRAAKIVEHREKNGPFINREQLLTIKGIGPKTYEQCAGFVRICAQSTNIASASNETPNDLNNEDSETVAKSGRKRKAASGTKGKSKKVKMDDSKPNLLDMTWIHPESYHIAEHVLETVGASVEEIGHSSMRNKIQKLLNTSTVETLAENVSSHSDVNQIGAPTMTLIVEGLQQPRDHDIRKEYAKPLFKKSLVSINDLHTGTKLTGRVQNVTHFGAFVDIGVGASGLLHNSKMHPRLLRNGQPLGVGDRVEVKVMNVDIPSDEGGKRGYKKSNPKIGLELVAVL